MSIYGFGDVVDMKIFKFLIQPFYVKSKSVSNKWARGPDCFQGTFYR